MTVAASPMRICASTIRPSPISCFLPKTAQHIYHCHDLLSTICVWRIIDHRNRLSGPLVNRIDFHVAARYSDAAAFFIASTASSMVSRGVVLTVLQAPPAAKAMAIAPASTLLGI
jgi:hypothetical protein